MWITARAVLVLAVVIGLRGVSATPLQPTFSSCLNEYPPLAASDAQFVFSQVYAEVLDGVEASKLGLPGNGNSVLRVDLLGSVGAELAGYDNDTNKLATLFTETRTASFNVYSSASWLCNSIYPVNYTVPLNTTDGQCPFPAGDVGLNISIPLYRSYALTTLHTQIRLVDSATPANTLACLDMDLTPYKQNAWYYNLFLGLPIALAIGYWIASWGARFAAGWVVGSGVAEYEQKEGTARAERVSKREATMRKWGTMIISGLSGERFSVSGGLLRFVTPSLRDIVHHIQFCTILAMVAVSWPDFAYPILAQGGWADLVWNVTLVQGSSDRVQDYPTTFIPPSQFADQITDTQYPLFLDGSAPNQLLDLYNTSSGMKSFAFALGLRPQDLFGTCLALFCLITLAVILVSALMWFIHAVIEFCTMEKRSSSKRQSIASSPSLGGKEVLSTFTLTPGQSHDFGTLPTRANLSQGDLSKRLSTPTRLRRTWWRFRFKGEAGAFHAAALYGNLSRLIIMFHLPITTFSIYQLCLGKQASIISRVFAALAFAFISVLIPAGLLFKISRTPTGKLYDATRTLLSLGPMYNVYVEEKQMFRVFPLAASLTTGVVVGAGQHSGLAQGIILTLVELAMLIIPAVWYPWGEGASMGAPSAFIGSIRVASMVLTMLLSDTLNMTTSTDDWLAYAILLLQAIVFVFFAFMLVTKIIEGVIRLFGDVHFDESTSPLDGGIFAAIMDLDCLNGVRGGKAAARKRRKRGSKQLQRNVSAAGSLTTQMMLDRHSQGVPRMPVSEANTPFLANAPQMNQTGYFQPYQPHQPPLGPPPQGPPPVERTSSDSRSDERSAGGHIMDAWRPMPQGYMPPGTYVPTVQSPDANRSHNMSHSQQGYGNPYFPPASPPLSPSPHVRHSLPIGRGSPGPSMPSHSRTWSSSAIGAYESPPLTSPTILPTTLYHQQGRAGAPRNAEGLHPPQLAIPKRRSLNNLRDESPTSQYSDSDKEGARRGGQRSRDARRAKRKSKQSWFGRAQVTDSSEGENDAGSDDEPGPSRRRTRRLLTTNEMREPAPFEPVPLVTGSAGTPRGWKAALGLGKRKKMDEVAEAARDENKARKAALAAESGALFAGVEAPKPKPKPKATSDNQEATVKGFKVKRASQLPAISPSAGERSSNAVASSSTGPAGPGIPLLSLEQPSPTRSFVVKRPGQSPSSSPASSNPPRGSLNTAVPLATPSRASVTPSPVSSTVPPASEDSKRSFKVNRPNRAGQNAQTFSVHRPTSPLMSLSPTSPTSPTGPTAGYPLSAIVPVSEVRRQSVAASLTPERPSRDPRRTSQEIAAQRASTHLDL